MTYRLKKIGFGLLKLLFTVSILFYLIYNTDFSAIKQVLLEINIFLFCLSFIIIISKEFFLALRWKILLALHDNHFSSLLLTKYYYISIFFGLFLPTAIGGDIARWYYLQNNGVKHNEALSSILYERFLGIISLVFFASFSLFIDFKIAGSDAIKITMIIILFLGLVLFIVFWNFHRFLKLVWVAKTLSRFNSIIKFIENIKDYSQNIRVVIHCLILSLIAQLIGILAIFFISLSLDSSVNFFYFVVFLPMVWLISMIPISIGGLGLREGTFVLLFMSIGMSKEMAIAISALVLLQIIAHGMLGGIILLFFQNNLKKIKNEI
jgi:uncharacterized protein (TIRG00374 family)